MTLTLIQIYHGSLTIFQGNRLKSLEIVLQIHEMEYSTKLISKVYVEMMNSSKYGVTTGYTLEWGIIKSLFPANSK